MIKFLSALAVLSMFASSAYAGSVTNMDKVERKVDFTHVGYTKSSVVLRPGEVHHFQGPWLEISTGSKTIATDFRYEFVIQNGELVLMSIRDSRGGGLF